MESTASTGSEKLSGIATRLVLWLETALICVNERIGEIGEYFFHQRNEVDDL
jgi:hypothetical protein